MSFIYILLLLILPIKAEFLEYNTCNLYNVEAESFLTIKYEYIFTTQSKTLLFYSKSQSCNLPNSAVLCSKSCFGDVDGKYRYYFIVSCYDTNCTYALDLNKISTYNAAFYYFIFLGSLVLIGIFMCLYHMCAFQNYDFDPEKGVKRKTDLEESPREMKRLKY